MDSIKFEQDPWSALREKMNSLDHVPGVETPSTEYLWGRLQQRFKKDRRRRRIYRCSIAASLTILFSVLLSLSTYKNSTAPEAAGTQANVVQASPITITLHDEPTLTKTEIPKTATPKTAMVQQTKKKNPPSPGAAEPVPVITPAPEMLVQTPTPEIISPAGPSIATALPAAKPRTQIVHIRDMSPNPFFSVKPGVDIYEARRLLKKSTGNSTIASSSQQQVHILSNN